LRNALVLARGHAAFKTFGASIQEFLHGFFAAAH
jgi:hypothetical protein